MLDFMTIATRSTKRGTIEIYPKFIIKKSSDLMIRGGDFYAIWVEDKGLWSTDEDDVTRLVDNALIEYEKENKNKFDGNTKISFMWDSSSGIMDSFHKYCQRQMRDSFNMLDEKIIFSNSETNKKDYSSKRLPYPLETGDCPSFKHLISTLYSPEERHKIEWAIGSIVSGDSKELQKFMVLYGSAGTGKSTILNIIQQLFDGYYSVFDAKALGSSSNSFALESFRTNPLVAIQHDGDLSRIEDNTRLNSLVSHELMTVNEKFKQSYSNRFKCFLFMGTNKPVKITDAKSGLLRRLIDVSPSGNKLSMREYNAVVKKIKFELGAIANYCKNVYLEDPEYYNDYIPVSMLSASNDFYNYVIDSYHVFKEENGTTLKAAWEMYKVYCDEAKVGFPFSQRIFKEELRNYFREYKDRFNFIDGTRVRSYYIGFRTEKFEDETSDDIPVPRKQRIDVPDWLQLTEQSSKFDIFGKDYPAQYANSQGSPTKEWDSVKTTLYSLNTDKLHWVRPSENHIVIDFDIPDADGNKSLDLNLIEAAKFPPTYAETSKSGNGIHLHYIYTGDVSKLSRVYDDKIEIKIHTGKSSLRRKLSKCNDLDIANISSGLPFREEKNMINFEGVKNEKAIRTLIKRNLEKEYHAGTKPSIDFIKKILDDAYDSGEPYDVSDLKSRVFTFASYSSNKAQYCMKMVDQMKFKSEDSSDNIVDEEQPLVFYDVEVFKNLFVVCWKKQGDSEVTAMINPKPKDIEPLLKMKLVGFNVRRYDNHILYGRYIGYNNLKLYQLSQNIINNVPNALFREAYNISYTDIYDFSSTKQSLKKFEIELGLRHLELGLDWDKEVDESLWEKVVDYCKNDVIATEAVFESRKADFVARQILADLAKMTVNDTTNTLTTRIIFGNNKNPQSQFNYRDLGDTTEPTYRNVITPNNKMFVDFGDEFTVFNSKNQPIFPGYKFEAGRSTYRGEIVGEGGNVYAEPGIHYNVALLDVVSMHPNSAIQEELFGPTYTKIFRELVEARVAIKENRFDDARKMLGGILAKYLDGSYSAKDLATALKIAINSVYGLTAASFPNAFRDPRNKDNIVAKRGALFMINLRHMVQQKGYTVVHIKTDSIKIANADEEIIKFVSDYGEQYGYSFEHEDTYEKMCLVNDAVYIAKYTKPEKDKVTGKDIWWTATGTQFAVPYVYKTLFSKDKIDFQDLCETKSVTGNLYLDFNEELETVELYEKIKKLRDTSSRKLSLKDKTLLDEYSYLSEDELNAEISKGHKYRFVGKVGSFCPIKPNGGGGWLMREKDNEYHSATGAKGYRWLESEYVKDHSLENQIDKSYYINMVDKAIKTISQYGDFEEFVA